MIGVVGGGIAGLACAYRLQEHGHDVQVFEARSELGGLAAVHETEGDPIEKFYHHLSASEETIVALAEELGLGEGEREAVEWRYKSDAFYVDGVVHPMDTIWEIAAYPYLSTYDKFRLGMLTMEIDVRGGIPAFDTYADFTDFEDVPVREFLIEHTTERVYEHFWEPLLSAKFGSRTGDVSAAWLLGRIKFRGERDLLRGEQLGYIEGSFARLIDALIDAVGEANIRTGMPVTELGFEDGAVSRLEARAEGGAGGAIQPVDDVVIATMPNVLEELTGHPCDIDFQGTVCAVVSLPERLTDTYWCNFVDEAPFGVLIEHTNFVSPDRYGGEHLLYLASYVQDYEEALWQMDDEAVAEHWLSGLADLFPGYERGEEHWIKIARRPRTAPIYERGYLEKVVSYDLSAEVADGVYYAGMASRAQYPERSLNGGIEAGFACADLIAEGESEYVEE
jgi:protoporphyrinogen oxidase